MTAVEVRSQLVEALRLDLVGPEENLGAAEEILPEPPSRWYLTGFLVPLDADETQKTDEAGTDELSTANDAKGLDDAVAPEQGAARRSFFPSSVGFSFLMPDTTKNFVSSFAGEVTNRNGRARTGRPSCGEECRVLQRWFSRFPARPRDPWKRTYTAAAD